MQTGRDKTMAAPLLMTDPRRRGGQAAGSSLVQVGRTTPADETRQQQLTSLSEEEKLTAIFVSTLGGTVAAVTNPGDDETTSDGIGADLAEITGREKRIVAVACLTKFMHHVYLL
jgi:hypothetical protein